MGACVLEEAAGRKPQGASKVSFTFVLKINHIEKLVNARLF
jgi:hypothetical protein